MIKCAPMENEPIESCHECEHNEKLETIARTRYENRLWEGSESNPKNQGVNENKVP